VVLGESYKKSPSIFDEAKRELKDEILHVGFVDRFEDYARWLWLADILPVTSNQDFFGLSAVEAMYCETYPILPNRLAFPGHIPVEEAGDFLYDAENELFEKLNWACDNISQIRENRKSRNFVTPYDWTILAPLYDKLFNSLS
ncbi:MAG: glycosyltransferase, partial [Saprospiraceae bacterium]|nr:glycosyltransferase [Saprospiraceae bacterium]